MKVSCLQENLSKGLSIVGRAVSPRSTLPVLGNVLLATDAGRLKLSATNLEVGILIGRSEYAVNKVVSEYRDQGVNLPTRGWVHDIGRGPSHKKIILEYYLEGMLTPDIAARTYHHPSAVDRYIKNFEVVRGHLVLLFEADDQGTGN